ncbi:hypothetical protein SAMN02745166_04576 [Prosthecobacter debontii]|uniref:Uncharacterized protein n=1 Tax=Prosthecobacter debontii TaxID=48467 RepID=A0A1T4YYS7_9BACT|nr:hypothetical protein [Prosthecobacter debontii]SKB06886.1 hypothetical protein SAMN02745166_04576 [Prosthecobacter debontii]
MSESAPTSSSRKPLLADAPPTSETASVPARVLVTGTPNVRQEPTTTRGAAPTPATPTPSPWTPALILGVVQIGLLAGALAWGGNYLSQKLTNSRIGTSGSESTTPGDTASLKVALDKATAQISALQRQLDAQGEERAKTQSRLQEMADRMALVIQQSSFSTTGETPRVSASDASQVAAMLPSVSPATAELILIKERNRLTTYADKAIATGSRADLQALVEAMMDPAMKHLLHAAQAEFKRVQAYYDMGISIDPGYTLPVRDLFKDTPVSREADLTPAQLHTLLQDTKQPWEARLRAAYLLRSSNDPETNTLLLKALKEDPMLDVAKQAQITFENRVGRKFRLFDIPAIESWWQAQGGDKPVLKMKEPGK